MPLRFQLPAIGGFYQFCNPFLAIGGRIGVALKAGKISIGFRPIYPLIANPARRRASNFYGRFILRRKDYTGSAKEP